MLVIPQVRLVTVAAMPISYGTAGTTAERRRTGALMDACVHMFDLLCMSTERLSR
jgi:hypothetical protein